MIQIQILISMTRVIIDDKHQRDKKLMINRFSLIFECKKTV